VIGRHVRWRGARVDDLALRHHVGDATVGAVGGCPVSQLLLCPYGSERAQRRSARLLRGRSSGTSARDVPSAPTRNPWFRRTLMTSGDRVRPCELRVMTRHDLGDVRPTPRVSAVCDRLRSRRSPQVAEGWASVREIFVRHVARSWPVHRRPAPNDLDPRDGVSGVGAGDRAVGRGSAIPVQGWWALKANRDAERLLPPPASPPDAPRTTCRMAPRRGIATRFRRRPPGASSPSVPCSQLTRTACLVWFTLRKLRVPARRGDDVSGGLALRPPARRRPVAHLRETAAQRPCRLRLRRSARCSRCVAARGRAQSQVPTRFPGVPVAAEPRANRANTVA
jgi:hypothetical protein